MKTKTRLEAISELASDIIKLVSREVNTQILKEQHLAPSFVAAFELALLMKVGMDTL